jgi:hypothetical protein
MMVANIKVNWAEFKQRAQKFDGEILNLIKPNELVVSKEYQIEITNRIAALENLCDDEYINRAWDNIKENIEISANVSKSARIEAS